MKHRLRAALGLASGLAAAVAGGHSTFAQQSCFKPPSPVSSLADVTELLALQTPKRSSYVISDSCQVVRRNTFGPVLNFVILNRFPEGTEVSEAYVFVKSYRIFTSAPPVKISLSRGDGWQLPKANGDPPADLSRMAFVSFAGSLNDWNTAHATPGSPTDFAARLKEQWHGFAGKDSTLPSTVPADFWTIPDTFDRQHGVQTDYLIKFTVNTTDKVSLVPFQVYAQREVQEVQLTLFSNIDALSGTYRFVLK